MAREIQEHMCLNCGRIGGLEQFWLKRFDGTRVGYGSKRLPDMWNCIDCWPPKKESKRIFKTRHKNT